MRTIAAMAAVLLLSATRVAAQEHGRGEHRPVPDTAAHAAQTMTAGPLGIPRTREGSGTAWLPDASPMNAVHGQAGAWELMLHANAFVQYIHQGGERGRDQFGSINWAMGMARRPLGGGELALRAMLSAEPFTIEGCGYPLLLATGELCDGRPLHDAQHPHDLFMELAALYDTLLRWDPEERAYEPRTAESLTPDSTLAEWTLKIRPGISFGDGTPYNAEAVKINIERFLAPTSRSPHRATLAIIEEITVVNDLTVTFRLRQPWAGFPYVLTREPGMIVSPTAIATLGESLNLNPVGAGAGPFRIVSYKPDEAIVMEKNPDYWNGPVYLDGLRFVFIAGFAPRFEALDAGTLHAAFLRDAAVNARAKDAGYPGYSAIVHGAGWNINHGAPITCNGGKPGPACAGQPDGTTTSTNPLPSSLVPSCDAWGWLLGRAGRAVCPCHGDGLGGVATRPVGVWLTSDGDVPCAAGS